jgi:uncharacterized protein (TIGR03437 family)
MRSPAATPSRPAQSEPATTATGPTGAIHVVTTAFTPPSSGIAQNTWVEIQGSNLVPATTPAAGVDWSDAPDFAQGRMPTTLNGISVTIDGTPAYIYYFCSAATSSVCSQDQINVLSPLDTALGTVQVAVTNNGVSTPAFSATMRAIVPALFTFDESTSSPRTSTEAWWARRRCIRDLPPLPRPVSRLWSTHPVSDFRTAQP